MFQAERSSPKCRCRADSVESGRGRRPAGAALGGPAWKRLGRHIGRPSWLGVACLALPALILPKAALAIPSPDLAINFSSNAAQLLGLATAMFGGAALGRHKAGTANRGGAFQLPGRNMRWAFGALALLFAVSVGSNIFLWTQKVDDQHRRLQYNLMRPSVEAGKSVGDVSIKTLAYSEQVHHPLGISTDYLDQLLQAQEPGDGKEINFIDVREPEEQEVGWLPGFTAVRYPDLLEQADKLRLADRTNILICESGNRSSELCEQLAAAGIDCSFLIGGYGKWRAENRPVSYPPSQRLSSQRDVPAYPNKGVLLDTPDVKRMVAEDDAVFVDVRYPKEFAQSHLPGAINIPIRRLESEEMWSRLKSVPKRPVIAPCYDKRSCFYSVILGLRLHRLGYDFRGRYTVPHEYYVPSTPAPFEADWLGVDDRSWLASASGPFITLLHWTQEHVGPLWLAILLVVLLLRLLILPFTAKAERDQYVLRQLADQIADLKKRLDHDRTRLSRALKALYRKHRLSPGLNLLGICLQVPLFLIFFFAVGRVSGESSGSLLWLPSLGVRDPLCILPVGLGLLVFLHLQLNAASHRARYIVLRAAIGIGLASITLNLSAGVNFYLVLSTALMMAQSRLVRRVVDLRKPQARPQSRQAEPTRTADIVDLSEADEIAGCGNKAARLARMIRAGLPVPRGLVLTDHMLRSHIGGYRRLCESQVWANVPWYSKDDDLLLAVRSSGLAEDGAARSYAGVFESVLEVRPQELTTAIKVVRSSMTSERAAAYAGDDTHAGGIIVQEMIDADYAGVLFTEHPAQSSCMHVELVSGLGQAVADGTVAPEGYLFGRYSGKNLDETAPPMDLGPLLALGRQVEELFGGPQDIEWAYGEGRFFLLQSRDITARARDLAADPAQAALEAERERLLKIASAAAPDEVVFAQTELSELLSRPTPFSLSFMEGLFAPGGSTDLACRALGIKYHATEDSDSMVTTAFGALYLNRLVERSRFARTPGALTSYRLSRAAESIASDFLNDFIPPFLGQVRLLEAVDPSRMRTEELFKLLEQTSEQFIKEHYVQADIINIAADFYLRTAERQLRRKGLTPSVYLSHVPETAVHRSMVLLQEIRNGRRSTVDFLNVFGHRAAVDYEFAQPRYSEDPAAVQRLVERAHENQVAANLRGDPPALPKGRSLALSVSRACGYQALKEEAKHICLRELAVIRRLLVALDRRLKLDGGIFYLTLQELPQLRKAEHLAAARERIAQRRLEEEAFKKLPLLPSELSLEQLEGLRLDGSKAVGPGKSANGLQGTLVAGQPPVEGRARVVMNGEIVSLERGEILVARYLHPDWTPAFPRAGGIITEVGGWLSHAAIVAREYNVPTIVGARGALERIETGDTLRLHSNGSVEAVN